MVEKNKPSWKIFEILQKSQNFEKSKFRFSRKFSKILIFQNLDFLRIFRKFLTWSIFFDQKIFDFFGDVF